MAVEPPDVLDTRRAGGLIVRGGALRVAGYVAGSLLSAVSAALVARHLGAAGFGGYATVFSLMSIVATLSDAGISTLALREYAQRSGADRDEHMRVLLGLRLALGAVGVAGALAFGLAAGFDAELLAGTALAGTGLLLTTLQTAYAVPLHARLRLGAIAVLELARQGLTVVVLVALVAAGAGVAPLLGASVPVGIALAGATVALVRGLLPLAPLFAPRRWLGLLRITVVFALATAVGTLYIYGDQVLTSLVASERETGYFGLAFRVFIVAGAVPGLLVGSAFPLLARAARDDQARLGYALQRLFDVSLVGGGLLAIAAAVGAPLAIAILGGPGYEPAAAALRVQGTALLASFLVATWGYALISLHRHRALLVANALGFVVSGSLTLALAPAHGARGTAIATVSGEAVLALAYLVALVRARPDLRPRVAGVPRVALAAALALAPVLAFDLGRVGAPAVACALFAAAALALRAVPAELRDLLPARLSER